MTTKKYKKQPYVIFSSLIFGVVLGMLQWEVIYTASGIFSDLFLRSLQMLSLPMIFLAVTSTLSGLRNLNTARILGKKVLIYTVFTTLIAASIALILYLFIFKTPNELLSRETATSAQLGNIKPSSYSDFILGIFPSNVFVALMQNNVIGVVLIAAALGFSTLFLEAKQKETLHSLFSSLFAASLKVVQFIVQLLPLVVLAFSVTLVKDIIKGNFALKQLMKYSICIVGANLIQGFVVLPLFLKMKNFSPMKIAKQLLPVLSMAFFSKSSNATLPLTMEIMEDTVGVNPEVSRFSLPLCAVINMNGCAAFILITTLFVGTQSGMTFSFYKMLSLIVLSSLAAIGNAGIPMGCFFLTGTILLGMNCSLATMSYILPIYSFIDMIETALNVWSDCTITTIVNKEVKQLKNLLNP